MKNKGKRLLSILMVIVLLLSVTNTFAANSDSEVPYGYEPWQEDDSWEEYETFLPTGITRELAQGIWFDDDRGMYYIPLLGLYYDSESDMLFEPGYAIWWEDDEEPTVSVYDLPVTGAHIDGHWLEFGTVLPAYETIMPASSPTVTLTISNITNTSVDLTGEIFNIGGATIRRRGFWLRRDDSPTDFDEYLVNSSINPFGMRVTVTSGHLYHARAIIRIEGGTGSITSAAQTFRTPGGGGSNPTSSPPPGGSTATPPPGGGSTSTPPPGGSTSTPPPSGPTPTPAPFLSFSPANAAPWNESEWRVTGGQGTTMSIVNASQSWSVSQTTGTGAWLEVVGSGEPGTTLRISVTQSNDTGIPREATVTVRSGNLPSRELRIVQAPIITTIRGQRVIESLNRRGYVDVSHMQARAIRYAARHTANYPIWNFVHREGNVFAIRNETTGEYLTESVRALTHQPRISGVGRDYDPRQSWLLMPQPNGTYRIRSISQDTLYIDGESAIVTLSTRSISGNQQLWWIEGIWHIDSNEWHETWFGIWDRVINIRRETLGTPPAGFDFITSMNRAQNIWSRDLGVTFNPVADLNVANIRALGGDRYEIAREINRGTDFSPTAQRYGFFRIHPMVEEGNAGTLRAGGVNRNVRRLLNVGDNAVEIAVFSNSGSWDTRNYRNVRFATMAAIHELGHALGYFGHSPGSNDIMRGNIQFLSSPSEILRPAELEHLRQAYRFRRQVNPFMETDIYLIDEGSGNYE
ncbi:MAG: hypothetical protein FWC73_06705 [Defluviitaleaceae bacterium]|nr:hypothetical protein [Defluviitaleaceae bacterium]